MGAAPRSRNDSVDSYKKPKKIPKSLAINPDLP